MDVEGQANDVVEIDTAAAPPGPDNPYMNAISTITRPLTTEQEAARHVDLAANRRWKVMNRERRNELGQPAGYLLDPGDNALPYADPQSSVRRRAGFLSAHLWVTPYNADERYAAGDYINQSAGNEGLPKWTAANRSIANRDVVLWYTMGITHIPRPEDWPVMPVHRTGFQLVPNGFFDRNPALDVPAAVTAQPSAAQQAQAPPE